MAGKKGALHSGWIDRKHVQECVKAYEECGGNCKRAARKLLMTHQHLRWIWLRAGLKPSGSRATAIPNHVIEECRASSVSAIARKYKIPVSTLRRRVDKLGRGVVNSDT